MTMTVHAEGRTARLLRAGMSESEAVVCLTDANLIAEKFPYIDIAARIKRLARQFGMVGDDSNGDEVWAICRKGRVITLMLRRSGQRTSPGQMSVDKVVA